MRRLPLVIVCLLAVLSLGPKAYAGRVPHSPSPSPSPSGTASPGVTPSPSASPSASPTTSTATPKPTTTPKPKPSPTTLEQLDQIHPGGHPFDGTSSQVRLQDELENVRAQLVALQARLSAWQSRYREMQIALTNAYVRLDDATASLAKRRSELREQAKSYYMTGQWQTTVAVMRAGDVEDAGRATVYAGAVLHDDIDAIGRYRSAVRRLTVAKAAAIQWSSALLTLQSKIASERTSLEATRKRLATLVSGVVGTYHTGSLVFSTVIRGAERKESVRTPGPDAVYRPVNGTITSPFGWRIHPVYHYRSFHTGIDLSAPYGSPVRAARDGVVLASSFAGPFGLTTIVEHGGRLATVVAHQSATLVKPGDRVRAGEVIGYAGCTGWCTGPHVHFEVWVNGAVQNPILYSVVAPKTFYQG